MAGNSTTPKKDLVNKDGGITKLTEWATEDVHSVDDMVRLFGDQGVEITTGTELTGDFTVVGADEKQAFMTRVAGSKLMAIRWDFYEGQSGEFVAVHVIIDGYGKFIFNDGAKGGVYGQLSKLTSVRTDQGMSDDRARSGLLVARGLKMNKPFKYDSRTGTAIKRTEIDEVPKEFQRDSHPTWSFAL